jgi:hypothetical protein
MELNGIMQMSHSVSFDDVNIIYIVARKAVARLWHSKQLTRVTMIAHKTEEHVKSATIGEQWEAVLSTRSMRQLRDATIKELLGEVLSVWS